MAKGARKKTKWVLLTTAAAVPPSTSEKEADTSSKLPWDTKPRTAVATSEDCKTTQSSPESECNGQNQPQSDHPRPATEEFSNGYRSHHHHHNHHNHHPRSYGSSYGRTSHHYSGSSRRSHYGNTYRSSSSTAEVKNEQTSSVTINEDEYTKITTPRQDVLFKKGYLSRPKKYVTSENGGVANGSSTTTATPTDGSDIATGSGSVSTAESVTSDSTYLTDGMFMEYPTPYPYFGYIDQSGVLVMNGFAVDSNGYSYMNGGQTYIYPPSYNASEPSQSTFEEASQSDEVQQTEDHQVEVADAGANDEVSEQKKEGDLGLQAEESAEDPDQQMTPEQFLAPYDNGYDYAQFYNNFYYPGCVMAPFPVVDNGLYYDQFETPSENHFSYKKHRKWTRNWEEYPVQMQGDTMTDETFQDPSFLCTPPQSESTTEVPVNATHLDQQTLRDDAPSTIPAGASSNCTISTENSHNSTASSQPQPPKLASHKSTVETRSHPKPSQKLRKKDLIESTRAFAEQTIDLSRPTYLQHVSTSQASAWRTVCNGKEVTIEDDQERVVVVEKSEVIGEAVTSDQVRIVAEESKAIESKPAGKKESKRGKKTAKGKGKKQKRQHVGQQQKGFEVIEPEFQVVPRVVAAEIVDEEEATDVEEEDQQEVIEEIVVEEKVAEVDCEVIMAVDSTTIVEVEDDLEQLLHDVQITDLCVEEESVAERKDFEVLRSMIEEHRAEMLQQERRDLSVIEELPEPANEDREEIESLTEETVETEPEPVIGEDPPEEVTFDDKCDESCTSPISCSVDGGDKEDEIDDFRHFSGEEYGDHVDSGVQSPAAFISPSTATSDIEEKKERSYSGSGLHVTDAVTKWLSETLSNKRLEEMFVLPENPELLHRIQQSIFEESLAFSSDTYSSDSSGDEADDVDSDYMSDVQVKKAQQKTESQKDQLAKQTANDLHDQPATMIGDHSNCKQKRCIIM